MKGGLFLEMLGLDNPHALQRSFAGDTDVDACFVAALRQHDPSGWTAPYRVLLGNDERQFNAPGVRVPMLSLMRVLPTDGAGLSVSRVSLERGHAGDRLGRAAGGVARSGAAHDRRRWSAAACRSIGSPARCAARATACTSTGSAEPEAHRAMFTIMDLDRRHAVDQRRSRRPPGRRIEVGRRGARSARGARPDRLRRDDGDGTTAARRVMSVVARAVQHALPEHGRRGDAAGRGRAAADAVAGRGAADLHERRRGARPLLSGRHAGDAARSAGLVHGSLSWRPAALVAARASVGAAGGRRS